MEEYEKAATHFEKRLRIEVLRSCLSFGFFFHLCFNLLFMSVQLQSSFAGVIFLKALESVKIATLQCLMFYSCSAKPAAWVHIGVCVCVHECEFSSEYSLWRAIIHLHLYTWWCS